MRLLSRLRAPLGGERLTQARRQPKAQPRPRLRPRLEALDDRCVPSTLPVTNPLDDATALTTRGTLRYAVANAQDGDSILLTGAVMNGITLTQGELILNQQGLTIRSAAAPLPVTISGGNLSRVFEVAGGADVALSDVIVTGGNGLAGISGRPHETRGGGVLVDEGAVLTLADSTVIGNSADRGGGVADFGTLTVTGCTVADNHATGAYGGGIAVFSGAPFSAPFTASMTMTDSTVSGNTALQNGGGIAGEASTLTISDSSLSGNSTGALDGGGINLHGGTLTMTACTVSGNRAVEDGGGVFIGGAFQGRLFVPARATLTDCTVTGNTAFSATGFFNNEGGGIFNAGTLTVSGGTVSDNHANSFFGLGGGIFNDGTIAASAWTISNNTATGSGGGINNDFGTVTLENGCAITGNSASNGGGIANADTMTISGGSVSGNSADNFGGGIDNAGEMTVGGCTLSGNTANVGGGINNEGEMTVSACAISDNTAADHGGGIANDLGFLTVENASVITGNHAPAGRGADVTNNFGVLYLDGTSHIGVLAGHPAIPI